MDTPQKGDLVLATKYSDGDTGDHFCVGYYDREFHDRHIVLDHAGVPFRASGFRRVAKVSEERAQWLVKNLKNIEQSSHSVWFFFNCPLSTFQ
jgi:hypothetical protein